MKSPYEDIVYEDLVLDNLELALRESRRHEGYVSLDTMAKLVASILKDDTSTFIEKLKAYAA